MRRSQRISDKRPPIETITITDSEDDDTPLPRQERIDGSSSDDDVVEIVKPRRVAVLSSSSTSADEGTPGSDSVSPHESTPESPAESPDELPQETPQETSPESPHETPQEPQQEPQHESESPIDAQHETNHESQHRTPHLDEREHIRQLATRRKLVLDQIMGAINAKDGVDFVVKWKGLEHLERVPLDNMRVLFPQEVLDYMCQKIKWRN